MYYGARSFNDEKELTQSGIAVLCVDVLMTDCAVVLTLVKCGMEK